MSTDQKWGDRGQTHRRQPPSWKWKRQKDKGRRRSTCSRWKGIWVQPRQLYRFIKLTCWDNSRNHTKQNIFTLTESLSKNILLDLYCCVRISQSNKYGLGGQSRLFIVYLHCIRIQRIYVRYDDLAGCLHYIQLQFGVEPSEDSWRSKRDIFS